MPPQSLSFAPALGRAPSAIIKLLLLAGVAVLAGCATQNPQLAKSSSSNHLLRDSYLLSVQSDPLAAWMERKQDFATAGFTSLSDTDSGADLGTGTKTGMVSTAMKFLGVKYRYGGNKPGEGFDCSGLVAYAAEKSLGLKLPRSAREQAQQGIKVDRGELMRGDLVFFNTQGRKFSHVGIYLGDQKFVHAPRTGAAIRVESMDIAYWRKRYNGARRLQAMPEIPKPAQLAKAPKKPASTKK